MVSVVTFPFIMLVPVMTLRSLHLVAVTFALLSAQWLNILLLLILFKKFMHVYIGF